MFTDPITPPTPEDFDEIFDRIEGYLDKIEDICLLAIIGLIVLGVIYLLSKIFGGKK